MLSSLIIGLMAFQLAIAGPVPEPAKSKHTQCSENTYVLNNCTWQTDCNIKGIGDSPIANTTAMSLNKCIDLCAQNPQCGAVNFHKKKCQFHQYIGSIASAEGWQYAVADGCAG